MGKIDMSGKDNPFLKLPIEMPMTHRYKVYSEQNKNLEWLIKEVEVNYFKKRIVAKVYETANSDTHDWIEKSIGSQVEDKWTLLALSGLVKTLHPHLRWIENRRSFRSVRLCRAMRSCCPHRHLRI